MNKHFTKSAVASSVISAFVCAGLMASSGVAFAEDSMAGDGSTSNGGKAIGNGSAATGLQSFAVGTNGTNATQEGATAVGYQAQALAIKGTALGRSAYVGTGAQNSTAIGGKANVADNVTNSVALGYNSQVKSSGSVAIGEDSAVSEGATDSTAVGLGAKTTAQGATALGAKSQSLSADSIAIGYKTHAEATATQSVVIGSSSYSNAEGAVTLGYKARVSQTTSTHGVALGYDTEVKGASGIAIGYKAGVDGENSVSIGTDAHSPYANSVALGANSVTTQADSVSIGTSGKTRTITYVTAGVNDTDAVNVAQLKAQISSVKNKYAVDGTANAAGVAIGPNTEAYADRNAAAIGQSAKAYGQDSFAIGSNVTAGKNVSTEEGGHEYDNGTYSWAGAIGTKLEAAGKGSIVIGFNSNTDVTATDSLVIGRDANAKEGAASAIVIGQGAYATAANAFAIGQASHSEAADGIAFGVQAYVAPEGTSGTALGKAANVRDANGTAVGASSYVAKNATNATALGMTAQVFGDASTAVGYNAHTNSASKNSIALGANSLASSGEGSMALGNSAVAYHDNSVALGYKAVTSEANTVSVGGNGITRKITNVTAGVNDNDAVNVTQLKTYVSEQLKNAGTGSTTTINQGDNIKVTKSTDGSSYTVALGDEANTAVNNAKKLGSLDSVNAGIKGDTIVASVNNLDNKVGDQQYKNVTAKDVANGMSATEAIGALNNKIGDLSALPEGVKADTVAGALTNLNDKIGNAAGAADAAQKTADAAAAEAKKHNTVSAGNANIKVDGTAKNANGGIEYKVSLADDITVKSVKADTVTATSGSIGGVSMKDGAVTATSAKIGDVSISGDTIATGDTKITGSSVAVGNSELTTDSLKVNGKDYITADGINANNQAITNLKAGDITSASSTDAVTGGQLFETNQQVQANSDSIANLWKKTGDLNKKINRTGANAAALAALHPLDYDENHKVSASAGIGQYHGTGALAVGVFVRPTENLMFNVGGSFASNDKMFNAGVSYRFGDNGSSYMTKSDMSAKMAALEAENRDLRSQIEAIKAKVGLK